MKKLLAAWMLIAAVASAQMTMQQRVDDFNYLVSVLNRNYAPYEWKRELFGFDMLNTAPWIERIRSARTDSEYFNICLEYIANLNDASTYLQFTSDFDAYLGFLTDLYDGKAIVESVDRGLLPASRFNITVGDELVSIDGKSVETLLNDLYKSAIESNPVTTRRLAAYNLSYRPQAFLPDAIDLGATAEVVLRKADGSTVMLTIPWDKAGTPARVGPVPDFYAAGTRPRVSRLDALFRKLYETPAERVSVRGRAARDPEEGAPEVQATGVLAPAFALPETFQRRLGGNRQDTLYSGSYVANGKRIGFLRIPGFATSSAFLSQLDGEIAWLEANTDVLVLDQMSDRSSVCGAERIAARFIGKTFLQPGFEIRASFSNVAGWEQTLQDALDAGVDNTTLAWIRVILGDLRKAYAENRGRTGPLPLCGATIDRPAVFDRNGNVVTYTKPILLVTNEFSSDFFAAALKDAGRAKQFGVRTRGLAGFGQQLFGSAYSETTINVKDAMMVRARAVSSPGYPDTAYVESVGVHPEFVADFMTIDNFRQRGAPFVSAFTAAALSLIP